MSLDYAENRIREALRMSGGHPLKARQQVIAWTYEDAKLLHALAKPHLTGIVAHAVSRVVSKMDVSSDNSTDAAPAREIAGQRKKPDRTSARDDEQFGKDLLIALAKGEPAVFGQESFAPPVRSSRASSSHVDTMKFLSSQSRTQKKQ